MEIPFSYDIIYLHLVDLGVSRDRTSVNGTGQSVQLTSTFSPSKLLPHPVVQHWAIQVGNLIYELTGDEEAKAIHGKPRYDIFILPAKEWKRRCKRNRLHYKTRKIGATRLNQISITNQGTFPVTRLTSLTARAMTIWESRFKPGYNVFSRNCQNFAYLLYTRIRLSEQELSQISPKEKADWKGLPNQVSAVKTAYKNSLPYVFAGTGVLYTYLASKQNPAYRPSLFSMVYAGSAYFIAATGAILKAGSDDDRWRKEMDHAEKLLRAKES